MFRITILKIATAFLLLIGTLGLSIPMNVYAQASVQHAQSAQYAGKCEKIKDKQQKKACEKAQKTGKTKKNDDGPNHDANDDGANHH